jgi:tRNA threonylcarbamoyl adenosine modification protein YeaZ
VHVLTIDTATAAVTAGVARVGGGSVEVLAERVTVDARRHGEALAPAIAESLAAAGLTAADIGAVVAGVGPGPFTGLRVGLVTAVAFADALGLPTYAVCTLDAIARGALESRAQVPAGDVLVASDARRREVYWALYTSAGERLHGPAVDRPAHVREWLDARPCPPVAGCGAGAELYGEVLLLPLIGGGHPRVQALAELAAGRVLGEAPTEGLTPLYLRRPDAVEPGARKAALA